MSTLHTFVYDAQTAAGRHINGAIRAEDHDEARSLLSAMRLNVLDLRLDNAAGPRRPLRRQEFVLFNQQLAHLTGAGLAVESGLRLIAQETRSARFAGAVRAVADDLARGQTLGEAFETRRGQFPRLYGRLVDAGVAAGNLPGMLLNIGRHLELTAQLRNAIMHAAAYPVMVLAALALVLVFISLFIFPQWIELFSDWDVELPRLTVLVLGTAGWLPWAAGASCAVLVLWPVLWRLARLGGADAAIVDGLLLPLPLIGPVLRHALVARWCDTVRLGVEAGIDLPRAIELASDAIGSPGLRRDGERMVRCLADARSLRQSGPAAVLPPTVAATIDLSSDQRRLPEALAALTDLHRQQAQTRLGYVGVMLTPILLVLLGLVIGVIVLAMFLPLKALFDNLLV